MEDATLTDLEQLKIKLVKEISALRREIQAEKGSVLKNGDHAFPSTCSLHQKNILCEISYQATGILFNDVDKDWLNDKVYKYTANVATKAICFYLELTLDLEDYPDFEVIDITCHFMNIKLCFMLEITPWVDLLTKKKNYSLFMTAMSDYSEYNILRNKILDRLKADNYIDYNDCEEENGGIMIDVKSPRNNEQIYIKLQWATKFFEVTCHIEHHFIIVSTDFGMEFIEKNTMVLKKFCKLNLQKKDLTKIWTELCAAIDDYEA